MRPWMLRSAGHADWAGVRDAPTPIDVISSVGDYLRLDIPSCPRKLSLDASLSAVVLAINRVAVVDRQGVRRVEHIPQAELKINVVASVHQRGGRRPIGDAAINRHLP